jgi:hypothetical protein
MAYLTPETMRRYRAAHPGLTTEEVAGAYMAHVGESHIEGSCVFHQPAGCALPREMRGDVCNNYFCRGQLTLLEALEGGGPRRAFVLASDNAGPRDAAYIDESGVRPVPAPER